MILKNNMRHNLAPQKTNNSEWDLFNPIPYFNFRAMNKNLDVEIYENPYIQVIWEDTAENFTQERIKSVKHYFQKKYNSNNVNVITKTKVDDDTQQTIDVSINVTDKNYLSTLIKSMLEQKGYGDLYEKVIQIDTAVENRLIANDYEIVPFKRWYIKNIEFSNFLSYGENQKIDFDKCNGITVVESDPPNFGGKCLRSNTNIEIKYDTDSIIKKLGHIPEELSNSHNVITLGECYSIFKKYGNLNLMVNTPYGYHYINACDITEKDAEYLKITVEDGSFIEGSLNHKVKDKFNQFVKLSNLSVGFSIQTKTGLQKVVSITNDGNREDLYDIEVDEVRQYYSNGIVSHNSVLTVDLLLYLFFNTTTKTQKSEEIFNRFSDSNTVSVKGNIVIDGDEYIIARKITRKLSKSGDWTIKNELEFYKQLQNGELQNFTGEQRRETEEFIKKSIGSIDDFLMTILTTASNLEDLLEAKPTARGQVLSRFLGLEFLKKKEETGKEIYSEFSKGMLSNIYDTESLRQDITNANEQIVKLESDIVEYENQILDTNNRLSKGQTYKEDLLRAKHTDIEHELVILNPNKLQLEIEEYNRNDVNVREQISQISIIEPSEYYKENEHDAIKNSIRIESSNLAVINNKLVEINNLIKKYGDGIQCEHCGIKLMDAEITKSKISELDNIKANKETIEKTIKELEKKELSFVKLKKAFDDYERNKIIVEKLELTLESNTLKRKSVEDKLNRYYLVQDKIKKNNEIDAQLFKATSRIDELINEKRNLERKVVISQTEIKTLQAKITRNNEYITKIAEEFEREKIYKIYLEVFGKNGISKLIMRTMMPVINAELQRLLEDSCYFNLEVRITDKNEVEFIMIDNSTGIEKLMTSGSGYEKTIASMALRAVLSKVCSLPKPNIQVWDEVFGKISNDNLELVGEFFTKMKNYFDKIFVISHNPMINNWANNVVRIKKVENISRVIQ